MRISRIAERTGRGRGDIPRLFFPGGIRPHNTCIGIRIQKKNQYFLPLLATPANDGLLDPTVKRHLLPPQIPYTSPPSLSPLSRGPLEAMKRLSWQRGKQRGFPSLFPRCDLPNRPSPDLTMRGRKISCGHALISRGKEIFRGNCSDKSL